MSENDFELPSLFVVSLLCVAVVLMHGISNITQVTIYVLCMTMSLENFNYEDPAAASASTAEVVSTEEDEDFTLRTPTLGRALCCTPCLDGVLLDSTFTTNGHRSSQAGKKSTKASKKASTDIYVGNAFDIIFVEKDKKLFQNSEFLVSFGKQPKSHHRVMLEVRGGTAAPAASPPSGDHTENEPRKVWFPITNMYQTSSAEQQQPPRRKTSDYETSQTANSKDNISSNNNNTSSATYTSNSTKEEYWGCCRPMQYIPSSSYTPDILARQVNHTDEPEAEDITTRLAPFLRPGRNPIRYLLLDDDSVVGVAHANIYVWSSDIRIVVADIDGTITKSNVRGIMDTIVTENYRHCHAGICNFLTNLEKLPNTQVVYLTSRPLLFATKTRKFLAAVRQDLHNISLPEGPILGFGGSLPRLLVMELVSKTVHHFKSKALWDQLVKPFLMANSYRDNYKPSDLFLAAFGNSWMDIQAYHMVGVGLRSVYFIDKKSRIHCFDGRPAVHEEMVNLATTGKPADQVAAVAAVTNMIDFMPSQWYRAKLGSQFVGYDDGALLSRISVWEEDIL